MKALTESDLKEIQRALATPREPYPFYVTPFGVALRVEGRWISPPHDLREVDVHGESRVPA
jgi:hypothetical protein